jgi:DNA modification methylase
VTAPQGGELGLMMMMMMMESGLKVRHVLMWYKNAPTFSMGRLDYEYQHEPILLTWNKTHKYYGKGEHRTSVWKVDKPRANKEHPTMKPVKLVENALLNNSLEGDLIGDFYLGSGTTMVASHQLNRKCYGMEIDPKYCQVILDRMRKLDPNIEIKKNGKPI